MSKTLQVGVRYPIVVRRPRRSATEIAYRHDTVDVEIAEFDAFETRTAFGVRTSSGYQEDFPGLDGSLWLPMTSPTNLPATRQLGLEWNVFREAIANWHDRLYFQPFPSDVVIAADAPDEEGPIQDILGSHRQDVIDTVRDRARKIAVIGGRVWMRVNGPAWIISRSSAGKVNFGLQRRDPAQLFGRQEPGVFFPVDQKEQAERFVRGVPLATHRRCRVDVDPTELLYADMEFCRIDPVARTLKASTALFNNLSGLGFAQLPPSVLIHFGRLRAALEPEGGPVDLKELTGALRDLMNATAAVDPGHPQRSLVDEIRMRCELLACYHVSGYLTPAQSPEPADEAALAGLSL